MRKKQQRYIKNIKEDLIPFLKDHIQLVFIGFGVLLAVLTFVVITINDTNKGKDNAKADTISAPTVSSNPGGFVIPRASASADSSILISSSSISSIASSSSVIVSSSASTNSSIQTSSLSSIASSQVSSLSSIASSVSSIVSSASSSTLSSSVNSSTLVSSSSINSSTITSSRSSSTVSSLVNSSLSSNGISSSNTISSASSQSTLSSVFSSSVISNGVSSSNVVSTQSSVSCAVYNPDPIKGAPVCLSQGFTPGQNTVRTGGLDWILAVAVVVLIGSIAYYRQVVMQGKHKLHTKEKRIK